MIGVALAAAAGLLVIAGCAGQNKQKKKPVRPGDTPFRVEEFSIVGNEAFTGRELKNGLATRKQSKFRPFQGPPDRFNRLEWQRDLERILTYYHARGYFNARIASEDILRNPDDKTIRLRVRIREGKPAKTDSISVYGVEHIGDDLAQTLSKRGPLKQGERFTQQDYIETRGAVLNYLQQRGYAYANIKGQAYVRPEAGKVDVRFILDPGPRAKFGEVEIRGLDKISEPPIRERITFESGDRFSSSALQQTQESIYNLQVFSLVTVAPRHELEDDSEDGEEQSSESSDDAETNRKQTELDSDIAAPTAEAPPTNQRPRPTSVGDLLDQAQQQAAERARLDPEVPIVIKVKEARMGNIKVGAGFAVESNRQDVHGRLNMSSRNFLGGLRRAEFFASPGYAWAPGFFFDETESSNQGFILDSELRFSQPRFFEPKTTLRITPSFERDVQVGFTYIAPAARIGIDRTFFDHLTLDVGYRVTYYDFNNISPSLIRDTPLGQDFQEQFLLESLEQIVTLDYRNNPLNPKQGVMTRGTIQESGNYALGGMFQFLKVTAGVEGYVPFDLGTEWVLAARARAGSIYNIEAASGSVETGDLQGVPTISKFYSGGRGSMRSFGRRQISLYRATQRGDVVPVGGLSQAEMSIEPRFQLVDNLWSVGDVWGAAFVDAATVQRGPLFTNTRANERVGISAASAEETASSLLYGAGVGVWWDTPVGPVRADLAYTLTPPTDARFRQCEGSGASETGDPTCPKRPLADDRVQQRLSRINFLIGIGHSF